MKKKDMEIRINAVRFTADEKLTNHIQTKLEKLSKYNDRIKEIEVFLKLENSGQVRDKIVEIKAYIPGSPVFFVEDVDKSFEASFDKALLSLRRVVKKQKDLLKNPRYRVEKS
jgi:putative sigma-54 modulation protein